MLWVPRDLTLRWLPRMRRARLILQPQLQVRLQNHETPEQQRLKDRAHHVCITVSATDGNAMFSVNFVRIQ
jgi:hypothetical protein